jgi:aminoglycoside phosphotransferase (APT) family kinase protein
MPMKEKEQISLTRSLEALAARLGEIEFERFENQGFVSQIFASANYIAKVRSVDGQQHMEGFRKEERILRELDRLGIELVPRWVATEVIDGDWFVQVQTRLRGSPPKKLDIRFCRDLGEFLSRVHSAETYSGMREFDAADEQVEQFSDYVRARVGKFARRIYPHAQEAHQLLDRAVEFVHRKADLNPRYVLVHKDIYEPNILVDHECSLQGVVDWDAAQTAPPEWEFAIIRQRWPDHWTHVRDHYRAYDLDLDLMNLCAVVQALRFWKSFPDDRAFATQQYNTIRSILGA